MPMPPTHCRKVRHTLTDTGRLSSPLSTVEPVVVKPEGEYCSDGFAGETLPTLRRVENPPDLALTVLVIGEPQRDVSDRDAVMLDDQRKRASLAIDVSLC